MVTSLPKLTSFLICFPSKIHGEVHSAGSIFQKENERTDIQGCSYIKWPKGELDRC